MSKAQTKKDSKRHTVTTIWIKMDRSEITTNVRLGRGALPVGTKKSKPYIDHAYENDLDWDLSEGTVATLLETPCYYCGRKPGSSQDETMNLHRRGPEEGYTIENCVSCCRSCRRKKRSNL